MPGFLRIYCTGLSFLAAPVVFGQIPTTHTIQGVQGTVITLPDGAGSRQTAASYRLIAERRDSSRAALAEAELESLRN
jgi:LmbE family N-acetylglucosaminyl deacetylase